MNLADFHIHSNFSDGKHSIPEIVDFYGKRKFAAIAITDHLCETQSSLGKVALLMDRTLTNANFSLYQNMIASEAERALKKYNMVVIPGFEITKNSILNSRSGHVLALGLTEWIDVNRPLIDVVKDIKSKGGVTIAAHPVSTGRFEKQTLYLWDRRKEFAPYIDAWEVASGKTLFQEVLQSGLPMIANSDLHRFSQMNSWKTIVHAERNQKDILKAIVHQDLQFHYYQEEPYAERKHLDQLRLDFAFNKKSKLLVNPFSI